MLFSVKDTVLGKLQTPGHRPDHPGNRVKKENAVYKLDTRLKYTVIQNPAEAFIYSVQIFYQFKHKMAGIYEQSTNCISAIQYIVTIVFLTGTETLS